MYDKYIQKFEDSISRIKYDINELKYIHCETVEHISQMKNTLNIETEEYCIKQTEIKEIFEETVIKLSELVKYYNDCLEEYKKVIECASPPFVIHQDISLLISNELLIYRKIKGLNYRILNAPVKVVFNNEKKYYEPDIIVVADISKIKKDGCYGAPDIIIEIVSKSTKKNDYETKKEIYLLNGVKEYLIVDPLKKYTTIYKGAEKIEKPFDENISMKISGGKVVLNISNLLDSYY